MAIEWLLSGGSVAIVWLLQSVVILLPIYARAPDCLWDPARWGNEESRDHGFTGAIFNRVSDTPAPSKKHEKIQFCYMWCTFGEDACRTCVATLLAMSFCSRAAPQEKSQSAKVKRCKPSAEQIAVSVTHLLRKSVCVGIASPYVGACVCVSVCIPGHCKENLETKLKGLVCRRNLFFQP